MCRGCLCTVCAVTVYYIVGFFFSFSFSGKHHLCEMETRENGTLKSEDLHPRALFTCLRGDT